MALFHYQPKFLETYSKQNVGNSLQKDRNKDGPVLSFTTKYYFPATYHLNIEAISYAIM